MNAQELPYRVLPDYPTEYTEGAIVSRMVDGLGYRFYWATEGLRPEDLSFRPTKESRSVLETLHHIYGMSLIIVNTAESSPNIRPMDFSGLSFEELRSMTLQNFRAASTKYSKSAVEDLARFKIIFKQGQKQSDFPFWNLLNGMLSDCIYHTGQLVSFRRMTGNPINPNVNVFLGKTRG